MNDPRPLAFKVFVSHIHEEAELGSVVKDGIEDAFVTDRIQVFVSSDQRDNPGGEDWQARVRLELTNPQTRLLVSLISPASIVAPWVSVELGAAWALGRDIFPLCHSGADAGALPRPLGDFGGVNLQSPDAAERLIGTVVRVTGVAAPRRWPRQDFLRDMRAAAARVVPAPAGGAGVQHAAPGLPAEQVRILRYLAQLQNNHIEDTNLGDGATGAGLLPAVFNYNVNQLVGIQFAQDSMYAGEYHWSISPAGSGWLIAHGEMPEE